MSPPSETSTDPTEVRDAGLAGVARDNTWLFALNKSGTTFPCPALAKSPPGMVRRLVRAAI
jgi:hypothetical protein